MRALGLWGVVLFILSSSGPAAWGHETAYPEVFNPAEIGRQLLRAGVDDQLVVSLREAMAGTTRRRAQLTSVFDLSTSAYHLSDHYRPALFAVRALLSTAYDEVTGVSVYTDPHKIELEDLPPPFKFAGAFTHRAALAGARRATYLNEDVDHYVLIFGDGEEAFDPKIFRDLDYLERQTRRVIFIHGLAGGGFAETLRPYREAGLIGADLIHDQNSRICAGLLAVD